MGSTTQLPEMQRNSNLAGSTLATSPQHGGAAQHCSQLWAQLQQLMQQRWVCCDTNAACPMTRLLGCPGVQL